MASVILIDEDLANVTLYAGADPAIEFSVVDGTTKRAIYNNPYLGVIRLQARALEICEAASGPGGGGSGGRRAWFY